MERRANAPTTDADALARWEVAGRRGAKPKPTVEALDAEIQEAELAHNGLDRAVDLALEQKCEYVEKHRDRLANVARQQAEDAHKRLRGLLDELEETRTLLWRRPQRPCTTCRRSPR